MSNARYASTMQKNVVRIDFDRVGLGTRTDAAIAKDFGIPRRRVTKERAKRNIPAYTKANPGVTYTPVGSSPKVTKRSAPKPVTQAVAATPVSAAPTPAPPVIQKSVQKRLKNYIALVLDKSGSMNYLADDVRNVYRGLVKTIRENAQSQDQDTSVSVFTFSNRVTRLVSNEDVSKLDENLGYYPDGMTALWDGTGEAIRYLRSMPDADQENVSFLIIVITDGEENSSREFSAISLKDLMKQVQATDRWSLAFQLPPGHKDNFAKNFGIPSDNIREWEGTKKGVQTTGQVTNAAIGNYYQQRTAGVTASKSFFTTDMSKVSIKEIKNKLDDISDRFKSYTLEKEMAVKEFVELRTKKPYVIGSAYYMLFKTEEIQPQKQVLIMEKGKKAVWGGDEARKLIGLPQGVTAKVKPGNHANYDIFCQSTSVNRILPRGTVVLVDTTKLVDDVPTWDHTKVAK